MADASRVADDHFAVTPSNTANFATQARALRINVAGDVAVVSPSDTVVTYTCVAGEVLAVRCKRVNSTGTTATGIVGWT